MRIQSISFVEVPTIHGSKISELCNYITCCTKTHLINKINQIRCARNDIFHNKPTKIKFKKDLEAILLRLGYNLKDAIDIGEIQNGVKLKYKYE